jgi:Protein of unknown function (DUF3089)
LEAIEGFAMRFTKTKPMQSLAVLVAFAFIASASLVRADELAPPDYSNTSAWAAFPGLASHVEDVPSGVNKSKNPSVPVFFIHPTTYLTMTIGNAAFDAREANERVDDVVLRAQATVFNDCCKIFAPRYRQASLRAVTSNSPVGYAATDLAYGDVARAFDEFLRLNPEGPFLIASHSQGSIHALRLLQEKIAGTPLQKRLVAAYAIGLALPTEIAAHGLPVCSSEKATGCVITWNTVKRGHVDRRREEDAVIWWDGRYQPIAGRELVCVNPLDWQPGGQASASKNKGAIYGAGRPGQIPAPLKELTGAWCENGLLGIDIPMKERRYYADALTMTGVYHDFDYALFYMNIRANVITRIKAWQP